MFVWSPRSGRTNSYGFTYRYRDGLNWQHWRLTILQRGGSPRRSDMVRDPRRTRRTGRVLTRPPLTVVELSQWTTKNGTSERIGTKGYVRLKIAWPGRQI